MLDARTSTTQSLPLVPEEVPVNIHKYDGKKDPSQWIRCYSAAIRLVGDDSVKAVYFLMVLETTPFTWLKQLPKGSSAGSRSHYRIEEVCRVPTAHGEA